MMKEKAIPNYIGYFAGEDGEIYSRWSRGPNPRITKCGRKLKSFLQGNGKYLKLTVKKDNTLVQFNVHRLVCLAWHGLPKKGEEASHLNGDSFDNRPDNIKWESRSKNHKRKLSHGTHDRGYKNSRAKINKCQLGQIRLMLSKGNLTHKKIGENFNVSRTFITKISNGYRYKDM